MYRVIYNELLNAIRGGKYPEGSRLPSEKELADLYQVSRITSKKSLEMLADRGYVIRKPGKGTFVTGQTESDSALALSDDNEEIAKPDSRTIGVIMDYMNSFFGGDIFLGIEYECRRRGLIPMVRLTYGSQEQEAAALRDLVEAGVSGIIIMCVHEKTFNPELLKLYMEGFPIILLDRELKGMPIPVVTTDNYRASCELTELLVNAGHTRIAFLSHSSSLISTVNERFAGFRDTLLRHGLLTDKTLWKTDLNAFLPHEDEEQQAAAIQETNRQLNEFLDSHPDVTSFFVLEQGIAVALFKTLYNRGLHCDMVFFDGFEEVIDPLPAFPRIIQGQYEMGVTAVRLLVHLIRGEEVKGRHNIPYRIINGQITRLN